MFLLMWFLAPTLGYHGKECWNYSGGTPLANPDMLYGAICPLFFKARQDGGRFVVAGPFP